MSIDSGRRSGRYIKASEIGTYVFCRRAWWFERTGASSSREPERAAGTAYHASYGERVASAGRSGALARWCLAFGVVLLLIALLGALR